MNLRAIGLCALLVGSVLGAAEERNQMEEKQTPLERLLEGNRRFINGDSTHPNRSEERRVSISSQQEPFAIIMGCSDSRVPHEILFDQGLGDLFSVRVAGNVVGPIELDSIEYAAIYLHAPLILVLGHENCGAVTAVLEGKTQDIESVAQLIEPAIQQSATQKGNRLENAIKDNVINVVEQLRNSPVIKKLIEQKKLEVVGGYYHFQSGEVELIDTPASK